MTRYGHPSSVSPARENNVTKHQPRVRVLWVDINTEIVMLCYSDLLCVKTISVPTREPLLLLCQIVVFRVHLQRSTLTHWKLCQAHGALPGIQSFPLSVNLATHVLLPGDGRGTMGRAMLAPVPRMANTTSFSHGHCLQSSTGHQFCCQLFCTAGVLPRRNVLPGTPKEKRTCGGR